VAKERKLAVRWCQAEQDNLADAEEKVTQLVNQKADYEEQLRELEERLAEAEATNEEMNANNKQLDEKLENMKKVCLLDKCLIQLLTCFNTYVSVNAFIGHLPLLYMC